MNQLKENIMLKANLKIPTLTALSFVCCLLTAIPAIANPEKDLYGNDISDRIPAYMVKATVFVANDDFRAPPPSSSLSTGSIDKVAKCSRQNPSLCPLKSRPGH
jgi:hypothetical protein